MGDNHRFQVLSDFISRNFKPCKVADVAGGTGVLSYHLALKGFHPSVIDPRKSDLPKEYRSKYNRSRISIQRFRQEFIPAFSTNFDLIVGLHPDQATEPICQAVVRFKKSAVIVPCCYYWSGIKRNEANRDMASKIEGFFASHGINYWETTLPMNGKNIAIVVKRT